ncbi:MAG: winged helix-turn-helix domain-containing protein [Candidatus Bipolaricaulia bacterium]
MHRLFKVLGSEQRLKLLRYLLKLDEPICYCELEGIIDRDRSVIYRHLKKMEEVGLLKTKRAGKRVECEVRNKEKVNNLLELATELTQTEVNQSES